MNTTRGICRICGCSDGCACPRGCQWLDTAHTLCSDCVNESNPRFLADLKLELDRQGTIDVRFSVREIVLVTAVLRSAVPDEMAEGKLTPMYAAPIFTALADALDRAQLRRSAAIARASM